MDITETDYTTDPPTVTKRDFTPEELAQREADIAAVEQHAAETVQAEEKAIALRKSAEAKLKKLGLTIDEIQSIIG